MGLFSDVQKASVTQASELANLLEKNNYLVTRVSKFRNKWLRLFDITISLFIRAAQYDVAVVQFYSGNSFIWQSMSATIVRLLGKKLVFTIHGGGVPDAIDRSPQRYLSVLRKADAITVPSGFIKNKLSQYDIQAQEIENTIQLSKYPFINKEVLRPLLLWMRAFGEIYNPLMAVQVVANLKAQYPNVKLYMGGMDFGLLQRTNEKVNSLGLTDNIEIVGFVNFEKKKKLAELCDIYISTNRIDNAPVTFLEMWAMGLPIVSTNVGGVRYLIDDRINGLLAEDDNAKDMAAKVSELLEQKELAKSIIAKGHGKVAAHDEDVVYHKWDKLLTEL